MEQKSLNDISGLSVQKPWILFTTKALLCRLRTLNTWSHYGSIGKMKDEEKMSFIRLWKVSYMIIRDLNLKHRILYLLIVIKVK